MPRLEIIYRGYSFFEYRIDGLRLFVDPAFSRFDRGDWLRRWEPEPCEYVFVTHRHFDHYLDALDVLEEFEEPMLVAAPFVCDHARRQIDLPRSRTLPLRSGERARAGQFAVTAIDADHRGFRGLWAELLRRPSDLVALMRTQAGTPSSEAMQSFLFEFGPVRVQHHGEGFNDVTDFAELEQLAKEEGQPDVVVCGADLTFAEDVAEAVEILKPKVVLLYPPHDDIYRRFRIRTWPLKRFEREIAKSSPEVEVVNMTPDDKYEIEL